MQSSCISLSASDISYLLESEKMARDRRIQEAKAELMVKLDESMAVVREEVQKSLDALGSSPGTAGPSLQTSGMVFKNVRIGSKCFHFVTHAYFRK